MNGQIREKERQEDKAVVPLMRELKGLRIIIRQRLQGLQEAQKIKNQDLNKCVVII